MRILKGKLRILAVGAHPADVPKRAGGTLVKYVAAGHEVYMATLTYGETKESQLLWEQPGMSIEKAKPIRRKEFLEASNFMGVKPLCFDYGDHPNLIVDDERADELANMIRKIRPHIVLTHWILTLYDDHREAGKAICMKAIPRAADRDALKDSDYEPWQVKNVFLFEPAIGLMDETRFIPDLYIDITAFYEKKMKALRFFWRSQTDVSEYYAGVARYCGLQARVKYAERFIQFRPRRVFDFFPLSP